jgi:prepilin-type N-terminal cleavage/methylation domain-containing protein
MKRDKKGFTLIEMLIVVAIIGLLATVVLFAVSRARKKAVASQMKAHVEEIMKALEMAATDGLVSVSVGSGLTMDNGETGDDQIVYIQQVPNAPSCDGCAYEIDTSDIADEAVTVDVSTYEIIATGFEGTDTFTCTNGSCYCSINGGCLAIP